MEYPSGKQFEISAGEARATLTEVGATLRDLRIGDRALIDGFLVDERCTGARGQTLIPWPNRLADGAYEFRGENYQLPLSEPAKRNAIHGLVRFANWVLDEQTRQRVVLTHVLHAQPGYPFTLALRISYLLSPRGLTVETTARNIGATPAPYATGAHPYLTVGTRKVDQARLHLDAGAYLPSDNRGLPKRPKRVRGSAYDFRTPRKIGNTQLDTAFRDLARDARGRASVKLVNTKDDLALTLWMDANYTHVMAFTGDTLDDKKRHRRALGIEPMTAPPNAFVSGDDLRVLEPDEAVTTTWGIEWRTG